MDLVKDPTITSSHTLAVTYWVVPEQFICSWPQAHTFKWLHKLGADVSAFECILCLLTFNSCAEGWDLSFSTAHHTWGYSCYWYKCQPFFAKSKPFPRGPELPIALWYIHLICCIYNIWIAVSQTLSFQVFTVSPPQGNATPWLPQFGHPRFIFISLNWWKLFMSSFKGFISMLSLCSLISRSHASHNCWEYISS